MSISSSIKDIKGTVVVQIEGYFTERFINLCKINNIKIWNIRQIVSGVTRFAMHISDFKKLRKIAKKTKCKVVIKEKKGIYFTIFKYRKRKLLFIIFLLLTIFLILFSTHIWQINVTGNSRISSEQILNELKNSGLYIGRSKLGISKKDIINSFRAKMPEVSWVGIEINGTNADIQIIEKTKIEEKYIQDNSKNGDIIANKSGVITKIIAENGTAKFKEGSYVEKGSILIEGIINSKVLEPKPVHAKGIVILKSEYIFEKEYKFSEVVKEATKNVKYTVGFSVNNKENMLNYLNKNKKYDITKSSKNFSLFGSSFSFDTYTCVEYVEKQVSNSKEQLIKKAQEESNNYIQNEVIKSVKNGTILSDKETIEERNDGIIYKKVYNVNEEVGEFVVKE
jgi:similar to stage IV sporulation protein